MTVISAYRKFPKYSAYLSKNLGPLRYESFVYVADYSNYRKFPKYSDTRDLGPVDGCTCWFEGPLTVNFLNIRTPKIFVVITLKFELRGSTIE